MRQGALFFTLGMSVSGNSIRTSTISNHISPATTTPIQYCDLQRGHFKGTAFHQKSIVSKQTADYIALEQGRMAFSRKIAEISTMPDWGLV